jgi:hypothetical protein
MHSIWRRECLHWGDAKKIAGSSKRSAEVSDRRRKGGPFQSAMSMLNSYINRAGQTLPQQQKRVLLGAKGELRRLFDHAE